MNHFGTVNKSKDEKCETCTDFQDFIKQQTTKDKSTKRDEMPMMRNEYGRAAWSYLHTMAAYYPSKPSDEQQTNMSEFIRTFAEFFPCHECAEDFKDEIKKSPPRLSNRHDLSQWFCEQHNNVNRKLGKSEFDCARVLERWRLNYKKKD